MSLQNEAQRKLLHPTLRQLVDALARDGEKPDERINYVAFLADDAFIEANVKEGGSRVRIRAYLLDYESAEVSNDEVIAWVKRQPPASSGVVQASQHEAGGIETVLPRLVFERPVEGFTIEHIREDISRFARAWGDRVAARAATAAVFERGDPVEGQPQNCWLLMGDGTSLPSPHELRDMWDYAQFGVYEHIWTGPKNGELGDLALLYFIAPTKAVCFATRLASRPFWTDEFDVNAELTVDHHQWWVYLAPLIEIEPIHYRDLEEAAGGYLPLRGRSGRYLAPDVVRRLRFVARHPEQQDELDRVVQVPQGLAHLPRPDETVFDQWRRIPSGMLSLEAKVSEHIVVPLVRLICELKDGDALDRTRSAAQVDAPRIVAVPEVPVNRGYVDFVVEYDGVPALAIEVKLAVLRPRSGDWLDSPDFRQLRRYMRALGTPGLLIDAQRVLLVQQEGDAPFAEIVRADATWEDLILIRELAIGGSVAERAPVPLGRATATRFVISLGPNPMNPSSADAPTEDLCAVVANGLDSPIASIEHIGNPRGYELISSYLADDPELTPRQAVGILGMRGMYRLDGWTRAD